MLCFKFCKLSNIFKIKLCSIYAYYLYTSEHELYGGVIDLSVSWNVPSIETVHVYCQIS